MGRPLYSSVFRTTPVVRDPEPPRYEKWSYLNAFDPDSDEFFDSENAVYEDFIDPVTSMNPEEEEEDDEEDEGEGEGRDVLVVRMGNASPVTSESSLSDDDSPLAVDTEDPPHLVVDAFYGIRQTEESDSMPVVQDPAIQVRLATRTLPREGRRGSQTADAGRSRSRRGPLTTAAVRAASYFPRQQRDESLAAPSPSAPIPVPAASRRSAVFDERVLPSPSTPSRQTPMTYLPMSPPPSTTPRLYSWARNPSHPTSSSGGPFTNPHARTSYTHLSPALMRIRDVTV